MFHERPSGYSLPHICGPLQLRQSVLSAVGEKLGLKRELALRVAQGFGGGMGSMGLTCGAVTGAFMAIGLVHARTQAGQDAAKTKAYELVNEFARRFNARHGSIECRTLVGFDISDPAARAKAVQDGSLAARCTPFVRDAVEILEELLPLDQGKFGVKP